jgi:carboxylate-amine ligase
VKPSFTIGIEEEFMTIDPESRDLRSHIQEEIIAKGKLRLEERVKPEMHQSVVEVGTRVCQNIKEAREDVKLLRREIIKLPPRPLILSRTGANRKFTPTSATRSFWKTCNSSPAQI